MNDNNEIKKENNKREKYKKCCNKHCLSYWFIALLVTILVMTCALIVVYIVEINKYSLNDKAIVFTTWLICITLILITAIICFTIAICKCMQPNIEKCNSYDEALTEMLTKKNNEQKEEKNNNEQNKD